MVSKERKINRGYIEPKEVFFREISFQHEAFKIGETPLYKLEVKGFMSSEGLSLSSEEVNGNADMKACKSKLVVVLLVKISE